MWIANAIQMEIHFLKWIGNLIQIHHNPTNKIFSPDLVDVEGEEKGVEVRTVDDWNPHVQEKETEITVILWRQISQQCY